MLYLINGYVLIECISCYSFEYLSYTPGRISLEKFQNVIPNSGKEPRNSMQMLLLDSNPSATSQRF